MKMNVKNNLGYFKPLLIISLLAVAFSALGALLGELFAAASAGFIACLFVFENKGRRILSYIIPVLIIVISLLLGGMISVIGIEIVAIALVIAICVRKGYKKSTCAAVITAATVFFGILGLLIFGVQATGQLSFNALEDYYTSAYVNIREQFVTAMSEAFGEFEKMYSSQLEAGQLSLPTEEETRALFDSFLDVIISVAVIFGFLISGIALKVFSSVALALTDKPLSVVTWRFGTSNLFAIFYGVLYFVSLFLTSTDSIFALTVVNLHAIFLVVYAYVGFRSIYASLRVKYSALWCLGIIVVAVILLLSLFGAMMTIALDVLSIFGVMMTVSSNNMLSGVGSGKNDGEGK